MKKVITKEEILQFGEKHKEIRTSELAHNYAGSRQYIARLIGDLVLDSTLVKVGSTRNAYYMLEKHARHGIPHVQIIRRFLNNGLEEHVVLSKIEQHFIGYKTLPENVRDIFVFTFSEMLNNVIDHSHSKDVSVSVGLHGGVLSLVVDDRGIGVFRNIMKKKHLNSELEAIQDLLKGKTTTAPRAHSGEGIFFTSRASDTFMLESYGHQLVVDNLRHDVSVGETRGRPKHGTRVTLSISASSTRHLNAVFREYTSGTNDSGIPSFNKTEIVVRLYQEGGVFVSRSQARRVLSGLEKFRVVILDFDRVSMIGQAFADEIFRVFNIKYPNIDIRPENANSSVLFMIDRVEKPE